MVLEIDVGMAVVQIPGDRENLYLVTVHVDEIPGAFANQATRERRNIRDRADAWIGLVLADNSVGLTAVVVANDRDAMAERDNLDARRFRPQYRARKTFGEIACIAGGKFERATALVRALY
jgi:hypothetical protein